jgi:CRP-like cAMP-binding protein
MTSTTGHTFQELDDIDFLRRAELFRSMPEEVILAISARAKTVTYNTGEIVVKRGEPGDRVFLVKSGLVEVMSPADSKEGAEATPFAYLGPGECFGELAILTSSPRANDVRVPEQAQLLIIPRGLFDELMQDHAGFASQLCVILAHRLVKALQGLPMNDKKELHGSLQYFDLPTVVQTLISSSQNGVMALSVRGRPVATLSFQGGNIFRASYGHRSGDEAVHHLFQAPPDADFRFSSSEYGQEAPDPGITIPAMALMMDSVRLQDELDLLKDKLPPPDTALTRASEADDWTPLAERQEDDVAKSLWSRLQRPVTVRQLMDESSSCHYHAARALIALLEAKRIRPVKGGER